MTNNQRYHIPVLLHAAIQGLNISPEGIYVDVTYGGGGHSSEILNKLSSGKLFAFDQDSDAVANCVNDDKLTIIHQNFRYLKNFLRAEGVKQVDGILADLGVSSHQFDTGERGFSIRFDGPLDMRMDKQSSLTAAKVLNTYEEADLKSIFKKYGELPNAGRVAWQIVKKREEKPFKTTDQLKAALDALGGKQINSFMARVFQALRIEVNGEMEVLQDFLQQTVEILRPGGRLVVISYHSLEDRLVKNFIKHGNFEGESVKDFYGNPIKPFAEISRKPITPDDDEISKNPRARSAKMRIAEKL
ncbi:MAG: 16S rRNA (cytosine(1402)-N(4))-methyltransferase RsmH [Flavobacteriales bacterium]